MQLHVFRRRVHHPYIFICFVGNFVLAPVMFHLASLACLGFGRAILGDSLMLLYCIGGFLGKIHGHAAYIWMGS